MTAIREDALAAWDASDEADRRRVLAHASQRAHADYQREVGRGQASAWCAPTFEVVRARREDGRLVAVVASSYRVYHYAQSGSDWSTQTIAFHEISVARGAQLLEQRLAIDERSISERDTDEHDDAAELREAIARFVARHPG